jgi:tRNA nucleotidyltransferase (CCA-adding enzyme)
MSLEDLYEIFEEFEKHIMEDKKPSNYFNKIAHENWFTNTFPISLLAELLVTAQSPQHHPEGSVWNHTMMVLDNAAERREESKNPRAFMWAALLHDLGKAPTTKKRKGKLTSYDHDKVGEILAIDFLKCFTSDTEFVNIVSKLVRWHMQILFVNKGLPYADIMSMKGETSIKEIALLGLCDRLGRGGMTEKKTEEELQNIQVFVKKCNSYNDSNYITH